MYVHIHVNAEACGALLRAIWSKLPSSGRANQTWSPRTTFRASEYLQRWSIHNLCEHHWEEPGSTLFALSLQVLAHIRDNRWAFSPPGGAAPAVRQFSVSPSHYHPRLSRRQRNTHNTWGCLLPNLSLRTRLLAQPWQQRPPPLNHLFWRHSGGGCPLLCPAGPLAPALAPARPPTSAFPRTTGRRGARPQGGHTPAPQRPLLSPATRGAAASATEEKAAAAERRERLPSPHLAASRSPTAVPARSHSGAAWTAESNDPPWRAEAGGVHHFPPSAGRRPAAASPGRKWGARRPPPSRCRHGVTGAGRGRSGAGTRDGAGVTGGPPGPQGDGRPGAAPAGSCGLR